jgi:NDP-sugar pyrophosphorylase family protein
VNSITEDIPAIVIADDFENKFSPITKEYPKILLPIAGISSVIEFTI